MTLLAAIRMEANELAQWASYIKGHAFLFPIAESIRREWPSYRGRIDDIVKIEKALKFYADKEAAKVWAK